MPRRGGSPCVRLEHYRIQGTICSAPKIQHCASFWTPVLLRVQHVVPCTIHEPVLWTWRVRMKPDAGFRIHRWAATSAQLLICTRLIRPVTGVTFASKRWNPLFITNFCAHWYLLACNWATLPLVTGTEQELSFKNHCSKILQKPLLLLEFLAA